MGKQLKAFLGDQVPPPRTRLLRSIEGAIEIKLSHSQVVRNFVDRQSAAAYDKLKNPPKPSRYINKVLTETSQRRIRAFTEMGEAEAWIARVKKEDAKQIQIATEAAAAQQNPVLLRISTRFKDLFRAVKSAHFKSCLSDSYIESHKALIMDNRVAVAFVTGSKSSMSYRVWLIDNMQGGIILHGWQGQNKNYSKAFLRSALASHLRPKGVRLFSPTLFSSPRSQQHRFHTFLYKPLGHPDQNISFETKFNEVTREGCHEHSN